jgi:hypothetical protein
VKSIIDAGGHPDRAAAQAALPRDTVILGLLEHATRLEAANSSGSWTDGLAASSAGCRQKICSLECGQLGEAGGTADGWRAPGCTTSARHHRSAVSSGKPRRTSRGLMALSNRQRQTVHATTSDSVRIGGSRTSELVRPRDIHLIPDRGETGVNHNRLEQPLKKFDSSSLPNFRSMTRRHPKSLRRQVGPERRSRRGCRPAETSASCP